MERKIVIVLLILVSGIVVVSGCVGQDASPSATGNKTTSTAKNDFGCFPPSCSYIPDASAKKFCEDWRAGIKVSWPSNCNALPTQGCKDLCNYEKSQQPVKPAEQPSVQVPQIPKNITVNLTVTVPYWTGGDVCVALGTDGSSVKLNRVNEVIYNLTFTAAQGINYGYYICNGTPEISTGRIIDSNVIYDYVLDWQGSTKTISKPEFEKSFYMGACHSCGVSYTKGNFIGPIEQSYDAVKANEGANWVNLVPVWFIEPDYTGSLLRPIYNDTFNGTSGWVHSTIRDGDLITLINEAHSRGLKVYLVPHLAPQNWGPGIKAKGDINPRDPDSFYRNYTAFVDHYAEIAQQTGVELFGVGNELDTLTQDDISQITPYDRNQKWRDVISSVRQHYGGKLTYSVSCADEIRCGPDLIKFWDALDVIGFEWYAPIATTEHESIASMKANAERIIQNHVKVLHDKYNKPVVLTEIGWEAYPGSCAHTYGVGPSKGSDRNEQASCYEAIFQAIENKDYIQGMQIWTWTANLPGTTFDWVKTDTANEVRFSITEKEIAKWYKKIQ